MNNTPTPPSSPSSASASASAAATIPTPPSSSALTPTIATPSPITALPAPNNLLLLNPNNPNPNSSTSAAATRRFPPPCWSNDETLALIESYREKWFSLRRTNLRAAHWDDVAAAVAERSLTIPTATPKSAVQCRHKIEKLRKRYRAERKRSLSHDPHAPPSSPWIFFSYMDSMENPNPVAQPNPNPYPNPNSIPHATPIPNSRLHHYHQDQESDYGEDDFYRRPQVVANGSGGGGGGGGLKFKIPKAVRSSRAIPINAIPSPNPSFGSEFDREMRRRMEAKRRRDEYEESNEAETGPGEMARAIRMLGEGYMRMEQMKMDMAREMERTRMEMELKRTEMIVDSQMRIVDAFVKGFMGDKKMKRSGNS